MVLQAITSPDLHGEWIRQASEGPPAPLYARATTANHRQQLVFAYSDNQHPFAPRSMPGGSTDDNQDGYKGDRNKDSKPEALDLKKESRPNGSKEDDEEEEDDRKPPAVDDHLAAEAVRNIRAEWSSFPHRSFPNRGGPPAAQLGSFPHPNNGDEDTVLGDSGDDFLRSGHSSPRLTFHQEMAQEEEGGIGIVQVNEDFLPPPPPLPEDLDLQASLDALQGPDEADASAEAKALYPVRRHPGKEFYYQIQGRAFGRPYNTRKPPPPADTHHGDDEEDATATHSDPAAVPPVNSQAGRPPRAARKRKPTTGKRKKPAAKRKKAPPLPRIEPTENEKTKARTGRAKKALKIWYDRLNELNEYKYLKGHTNVPQKDKDNPQLGIWVNKQRMEKKFLDDGKQSSMTQDRIRALESLGFQWAKRKGDFAWNERFQELLEYREEYGDVDVPTKYHGNRALGRWVSTQRSQAKLFLRGEPSQMTQERYDRLMGINFNFDMGNKRDKDEDEEEQDDTSSGDDSQK